MIATLLLAAAAAAAPSASDFASKQGFAVQQIVTDDAARLLRDWENPDQATQPPAIDTIAREHVVDSFIVFRGCRPNPIHQCDVTADFTLIGPQGQIYAEHHDADLWVGKAPPALGGLTLSTSSLGIYIEPDDPGGDYIVRADVTDHVAGITLRTEKTLKVAAPE